MKSENRIYLKGKLGNDARINKVGQSSVANFSIATDYEYKNNEGNWNRETTWHNVCAWQGVGMCDFSLLKKGTPVYVIGRIRKREFTGNNGEKKEVTEVFAESVDVLVAEKLPTDGKKKQANNSTAQDEDSF